MRYADCICRVGALAVALGVGAAVASTPTIGHATPDTPGSSATDSSSTTDESSATGATGTTSAPGGSTGSDNATTHDEPLVSGDPPSVPSSPDSPSPTVTVISAEDAHTSTATDDDQGSDGDPALGDADDDALQQSPGAKDELPGASGDDADPALPPVPPGAEPATTAPDVAAPTSGTAGGGSAATDLDDEPPTATTAAGHDETRENLTDTYVADPPPIETVAAAAAEDAQLSSATVAQTAAASIEPAAPWPVSALSDVANLIVDVASDLVTAALGPLAPGGPVPTALWTMLAFARREIGQTVSAVMPSMAAQLAAVQTISFPDITNPASWPGWIAGVVAETQFWLNNFADLHQWITGGFIFPEALRSIVFNDTPIASPMQVRLNLDQGVSTGEIPFAAYEPDGNAIVYSVPARGLPGAPQHGTVVVDNAAGTFTYTPDEGFTGTDTFAFVASDDTSPHLHAWEDLLNDAFGLFDTGLAGGHRDTATVTVFVQPNALVAADSDITGDFSVLTYNVAGLPFPLSGAAWPRIPNMLEIGSRINGFDIVNIQGDVAFHPFLIANAAFPDQTAPPVPSYLLPIGSDGLNSFSAYDIESLYRQGWQSGDNALSPSGFSYSRMHIPGGSSIDVYNVDTNGAELTKDDLAQLTTFIQQNSIGRAVIVTGDFGQLYSDPGQTLTKFASDNQLTDAWVELEYNGTTPLDAPTCAYADNCEQTSKVFYRSATGFNPADSTTSPVQLHAQTYANEGEDFRNFAGQDLSDHQPVSVTFGYSVDAIGPMNVDLANWMADLPGIENLPLTQLPIPGTHDSGSYGISASSPWALTGISDFGALVELPGLIQDLFVRPIAAMWSRTQEKDLYGQFSDGIRYVDLRLTNEPDGHIYIEHGLRGPHIDEVIEDIARFANEHPQEVLLINVARLTNFDFATNDVVLQKLRAAFGDRMVPKSLGTSATLKDLWEIDKNVIVFYADSFLAATNDDLWSGNNLWGPWANAQTVGPLLESNRNNLASRFADEIWDMSGTVTPDTTTIVTGILTLGPTSLEQLMWKVHPPVQQWLRVDFKESVNLVTADWYESFWPEDFSYSRDVIGAVYETLGSRLSTVQPFTSAVA